MLDSLADSWIKNSVRILISIHKEIKHEMETNTRSCMCTIIDYTSCDLTVTDSLMFYVIASSLI